ncbi:peptidyl-prolyl cis-trans isomerase PASTICCINO1-like [Zingiber officinale]|uniref:peptidyl-prolyl cis-trans isomerase PASTICCINO1-like n=1 Tax=Zingiber officinale TaxID=94328 RepID=UPI001C4B8236|nr:peptidyl-prolyl cis-trans isomerase PASTICCINO1-like [Zingiber officinale]
MIAGGPTDGDSNRARKLHAWWLEIHFVGCSKEKADDPEISFNPRDLEEVEIPHDDALIIQAVIANYTIHRTFVDTETNNADSVFTSVFELISFTKILYSLQVPEGLEMCVRLMLPGEIALVTSPPDYAYDKFSRPANVPEGAHVQWEIELLGFEMPKDWTGLTFQEIMDEAENIKNTGNRLFKEGKYELAKAKYEKVLREYNHVNPQDDEEGKIFLNSRNTLQLNVAACYQKMDEHRKSIETCNKVLDAGPAHVKALYRRGMAYMLLGDFVEAKKDFEMMMKVDKTAEPDAIAALLKLKQKEQETEKKARRQFKGLFDKKPGEISEVGNDVKVGSTPDDSKPETQNTMLEKETGDKDHIDGDAAESIYEPDRIGLLGRLWPSGSRIFAALGLNKCSIL